MLTENQKTQIQEIIADCLRAKFQNYKPESAAMPFHTRLLGKDRLALYSFIHSLSTSFGTAIFEPVAIELAKFRFQSAAKQVTAGDLISSEAELVINDIMRNLIASARKPAKDDEIKAIRNVAQKGKMKKIKPTKVDIFLTSPTNELFLFDLKSAKPNMGEFKGFKRTLLEWTAVILAKNPKVKVNTLIAIPYNPYEPELYTRWTMAGMLDLKQELKVAEEFWDFLGGDGTYQDLLACFETVGIKLRTEIDKYFSRFK
jgi:type II restriction enzyme